MEFTQQPVQTLPMGTPVLNFRDKTNRKRDKGLRVKKGCHPVSSCSRPVHRQFISSQKERRQKSASNKSGAVEWLCGVSALQNGRYFSPERSVETKRLDGQAESESLDRVLLCPNAQGLQEVSSLQVGKLHNGIQLPSIWIRPSSSQIHRDIQASSGISLKEGHAPDYIHR